MSPTLRRAIARHGPLIVAVATLGLNAACRAPAPVGDASPAVPAVASRAPATAGVGAAASATTAAGAAAATARPTRVPGQSLAFEGVHIRVPDTLAERVVPSFVPATPTGPNPVAARVRFVLEGYPAAGRTEPAVVEVFQGPMSEGAPQGLLQRYRPFFALLDTQPSPPGFVEMMPESLRQQFQARASYPPLAHQPGRGVRFLTQFGSAPRPINNGELMYVFQGLSPVQAAWISITAPITVRDPLVADGPAAPTPAAFAKGYTRYMTEALHQLGVLDRAAFMPPIELLDEMATSIVIDWPPPTQFAPPPAGPTGAP